MVIHNGRAEKVKIAYIGGGSRGWAWGLMSDLVTCAEMSGAVHLYDIDLEAAQQNEEIGNRMNQCEGAISHWDYYAEKTAKEAMEGADFVVISILPGTFQEMASDIHAPEKYGIYQSVGDSTGPGGIVRSMRTVPMFEEIAENVKKYCPKAWVINYTNPMTLCIRTLYRVFPQIKAFGCCHEVFGTQRLLADALEYCRGIKGVARENIKVNPIGVNHFTWLTEAKYQDMDLLPVYSEFVERYGDSGFTDKLDDNWMNNNFLSAQKVKMDLFRRYGIIAAAGDRHLAEFCEGKWYLENPEKVTQWGFRLTGIDWRLENLKERQTQSEDYRTGKKKLEIRLTGEEGVRQMCALLGKEDFCTNVNIPNVGQIPNLPLGAVVETNAVLRSGSLTPVMAGSIPKQIYPLIGRACMQQEALNEAIANRDVEAIFACFANDPLVTCSREDARKLFVEMVENTREYLTDYDLSVLK